MKTQAVCGRNAVMLKQVQTRLRCKSKSEDSELTEMAVKTEAGKPPTWQRGAVYLFNTNRKDGA